MLTSAGRQRWRGQVVVQTPAYVFGIGLPPVAPPSVGRIGSRRLELAIDIDQATLAEQARHPGALFGQKARVLAVAFPIFQVDFLVRNIDVTAQHKFAGALELLQVRVHAFQKTVFGLLPLLARGTAGEIAADDGQLTLRGIKAQFHIAALGVKFGRAIAHPHIAGCVAGVYAHPRVTFLLGKVKVPGHTGQGLKLSGDISGLGFDLLHAQTIGLQAVEPVLQAFAVGRADAVEV